MPFMTAKHLKQAMTTVFILIAYIFVACTHSPRNSCVVFDYSDFGPQVASYKSLGYGWYQWNSQGPDNPNHSDDVKVVVYKNISLSEVQLRYPVIKGVQDYRYLEYGLAIEHLSKLENDSIWLESSEVKKIASTTRKRILDELGK